MQERSTGTECVRGSKAMNSKRFRIVGIVLVVLALGSILLAACARPGTPEANAGNTPTSTSGGGSGGCAHGAVHMSANNFFEPCVNVAKGSKMPLIDYAQGLHIISNGMCDANGNTSTTKETRTPTHS